MNEIIKYIFLFLIGTTILNFLIAVIARAKTRNPQFNILIIYWVAVFFTYFAVATLSQTPSQIAFAYFFQFFSCSIMAKMLMDSRGMNYNYKLYIPMHLAGCLLSTFLILKTEAGFTLAVLPVTITTIIPLCHPLWNSLVSHRHESNWVEKLMGIMFISCIVNSLNYAFFRLDPNAAWWGWSVSIAQYQCLSVFLPLLINTQREMKEQKNIEFALEKLSGARIANSLTTDDLYRLLEEEISVKKELTSRLEEEREINVILIKTISHDLANPMTVIKSYLEMIKTGRIQDKDKSETLERIKDSTKAALDMIQRIRNAIVTRNQSSLTTIQDVDVDYAVKNLLNLFETRLHDKNIRVIYHNKLAPEIRVAADTQTLTEHVFANVLSNAIKFSYPESVIHINVSENNGHAEIEFLDHGIGFNRLKNDKGYIHPTEGTAGETGSGLGIVLMGYFLRKFGGSYEVTSDGEGKGARILILLKISKRQLTRTS